MLSVVALTYRLPTLANGLQFPKEHLIVLFVLEHVMSPLAVGCLGRQKKLLV
jgi:hypothetical protein